MANWGETFASAFQNSFQTALQRNVELEKKKKKISSFDAIAAEFANQGAEASPTTGISGTGLANAVVPTQEPIAQTNALSGAVGTARKPNISRLTEIARQSEDPFAAMQTIKTLSDLQQKQSAPDTKEKRQMLVDSTKIREEFLGRPEVKEYVLINTQVKSMDSLLTKAKEGNIKNKVALDQALITMFNKLTDPQSVVRESEYARTPENLPLWNRFTGAFQKLGKGGAGLTDKDREALVWGAKVIANERGGTFNETLRGYEDLSEKYGIDVPLITRGLAPHKPYDINNTANTSKAGLASYDALIAEKQRRMQQGAR